MTTSVLKSLDCGENNLHWYTNLTTLPTFESHFKIFISFFSHIIHFDYFSPPPTLLSSSSPTPYPPKVMFLSLKRKGRKRRDNVESALSGPPTPGFGACPGVWLIDPVSLYQRKLIFPFSTSILVRGGTSCLLPFISTGISVWFEPVVCHMHAVLVSVSSCLSCWKMQFSWSPPPSLAPNHLSAFSSA